MRIEDDILRRIDVLDFPSPPAVVVQLSQLLSRPDVTAEELAAVLSVDATISARVLRLANSALLGGATRVESIEEAVLRVGLDVMRDVVYALAMVGAMRPAHFDYRPFWRHSLAVAHTAQLLQARSMHLGSPFPETYAAGLLHDLGMLVFDRALGLHYHVVLDTAHASGRPLGEVEQELLGTDHARSGGHILEAWHLPPVLVDSARFHHRPWASESVVTQFVYLADSICNHQGIHHGTGYCPALGESPVWTDLGIDRAGLPEIFTLVQAELARAEALLTAAADSQY